MMTWRGVHRAFGQIAAPPGTHLAAQIAVPRVGVVVVKPQGKHYMMKMEGRRGKVRR